MKLNKEQYVAAHHIDGPMLVLAGPGSGKTHLLVERIRLMIEEKHIPPDNILVITFSKKAARQMQARFQKRVEGRSYPVTFGTFHAVFYHILQDYDPNIKRLITEEEQTEFAKTLMDTYPVFDDDTNPEEVVGMISSYRNLPDGFFARSERGMAFDEEEREHFIRLVKEYGRLTRKAGVVDFDDMIILCNKVLRKHEMFLRKWQKRYRYFLVDEFQDINDGQYDTLRLLAGDDMNVFAVGDDDQSIYAFRGSRPELMKKFVHQYVGCTQVTLTMNYRCCKNIIGAADTVIRHNTDRFERPMQRHLPSEDGGIVKIVNSENTAVQAAFVCDTIEKLCADEVYSMCDIAVIYRSDHCATRFIYECSERDMRIRTTEGVATTKEAKIRNAYLRATRGEARKSDFLLIMNNPPRGLSRESLRYATGDYLDEMKNYYSDDKEKLDAVYDLEKTIREYELSVLQDDLDHNDVINVLTAHASKGLEFRCVFVIGLQEGLFPHYRSMSGDLVMEERRLMYVAMTRAKERLYMCSVSTEHGKRSSRFIGEVADKKRYISEEMYLINQGTAY